jgi:hypothetical protein
MERHDPRDQEQRRREAEKALGNDRKRTPPVSDRPIEEPVDPAERPQGEPPR